MSCHTTFTLPFCPYLPEVSEVLCITHAKAYRKECGDVYFLKCLELGQSLWRRGSPAQAILQLDKSMMATLVSPKHPIPYQAILWIIKNTPDSLFIGNPVRHFQHLASRMNRSQPNPGLRIWRAWACLHLTEQHFENSFSRDLKQIHDESLAIPSFETVVTQLSSLTDSAEVAHVQSLYHL